MDDKKTLRIIDENGTEKEYEILLAYKSQITKKDYIVYTDNTKNENGNTNIFAAIYYPDDDSKLDPIETEEEWDEIEKLLNNL